MEEIKKDLGKAGAVLSSTVLDSTSHTSETSLATDPKSQRILTEPISIVT